MRRYLEKLRSADLSRVFWKTKPAGSTDSPESGWTCQTARPRKGFSLSTWILIALPLFTFLSIGIYFIVADVRMLKSIVDKAAGNASWQAAEPPETTPREEELLVRVDYVDLSSEDVAAEGEFIDSGVKGSGGDGETIIILKNDDSGKQILLRTSARLFGGAAGGAERETTTAKGFVYSPTIPQAVPRAGGEDPTTRKYNQSEDSGCFSTNIPFCEGVLPYDVVRLPALPGVASPADLAALLPLFRALVDSGCSGGAREFVCSVLEPECRPEGLERRLPCRADCRVFAEECKEFIPEALSGAFECRRYPEGSEECVKVVRGGCREEEFRCVRDGRCVPQEWRCDGRMDCVDESDEIC